MTIFKKKYFFVINRRNRYILIFVIIILIYQWIFNREIPYVYDPDIHQYVPSALRQFVFKSSSNYSVEDLLNLTEFSEEIPSNSHANPIHLLTQWYSESNNRRKHELISVLHMNVINPAITHIHFIQNSLNCTIFDDILLDDQFPADLLKTKLILHYNPDLHLINQRLTINQVLTYANNFIKHGYAVFLNLDIFFDRSLSILEHRHLLDRQVILYLSRYEIDPSISTLGSQCSKTSYVGSHDALIFQPPLNENLLEKFPFEMGTWHIEVKLIYELTRMNYHVRNPCKSIRVWHLHSSQIRHRLMPSRKYLSDRYLNDVLRYPEWL